MPLEFSPEPQSAIRCAGSGCDHSIVGYQQRGYLPAVMYCEACAESRRQRSSADHDRLMAADRSVIGDEAFVNLVYADATVQPSGAWSLNPGMFYILTFMDQRATGSSGYSDTPEMAWTKYADKIHKTLRQPYL